MATFTKPWLLERLWVHLLRIELPREHQVIVHLFHRRGIGALPVHNRQSPRSGCECHQSVRVMTILGRLNRFLQLFVDDIKPQGWLLFVLRQREFVEVKAAGSMESRSGRAAHQGRKGSLQPGACLNRHIDQVLFNDDGLCRVERETWIGG